MVNSVSRSGNDAGPMPWKSVARWRYVNQTSAWVRLLPTWGAMCMGANTYQWILDNDEDGWSYRHPCWVFTHRDFPEPSGDVRFTTAPVTDVHAEMVAAAGDRDVWLVGGGDLVGQFHDAGLLDEVWVQYAPVMLGAGAPLLPRHVELGLREVVRNGDFACARYDVVR